MSIGKRVKEAREDLGLSVKQLAQEVGMAASTLYDLERGDQESTAKLGAIAERLRVRVRWLESGTAPKATEAAPRSSEPPILSEAHVLVGPPGSAVDMVFVNGVSGAHLSAGTGEVVYEVDEEENAVAFRMDWMQSKGLRPERCKVWRVRGESMEPRYSHGDSLLIDMSDRTPRHGKFFALVGDGGLRVKQLRATAGGGWEMYSLNPDKTRFPTEPIVNDNYAIIGRVRGRSGDED